MTSRDEVVSERRVRYEAAGYDVALGVVPANLIEEVLAGYLAFVAKETGQRFSDPHRGAIVDHFRRHPDDEARVYDGIRSTPLLTMLAGNPAIAGIVREVLGCEATLLQKIVFRIDLPMQPAELAHWHQDYFYVKGDARTVTAWIPMQDTPFELGCLGVMPRSHLLGDLDHDLVVGKRHIPRAALSSEIRLVEMNAGDVLLFHSHLVHGSNLNLSDSVRYSIQARYVPFGGAIDPDMGGAITTAAAEGSP